MSTVAGARTKSLVRLSRRWEGAVRRRLAGRSRHAVGRAFSAGLASLAPSRLARSRGRREDQLRLVARGRLARRRARRRLRLGLPRAELDSGRPEADRYGSLGRQDARPGRERPPARRGNALCGGTRDGKAETETGMGVSAYSTAGGKLWHALDEEPVWWLDAAGGYVYVPGPGRRAKHRARDRSRRWNPRSRGQRRDAGIPRARRSLLSLFANSHPLLPTRSGLHRLEEARS